MGGAMHWGEQRAFHVQAFIFLDIVFQGVKSPEPKEQGGRKYGSTSPGLRLLNSIRKIETPVGDGDPDSVRHIAKTALQWWDTNALGGPLIHLGCR